MRRRLWIRFEDQVEVDLGRETVDRLRKMTGRRGRDLQRTLTGVYVFIRDLPDAVLLEIPAAARETLAGALRRLADRLETGSEVKP